MDIFIKYSFLSFKNVKFFKRGGKFKNFKVCNGLLFDIKKYIYIN